MSPSQPDTIWLREALTEMKVTPLFDLDDVDHVIVGETDLLAVVESPR